MAHSADGKITAPVSFSDGRAVLGTGVTNLVGLCSHKNINKWSLCKPMKHRTLYDISDDERKEGDFGFSFGSQTAGQPGYSSLITLRQAIESGTAWAYIPPNGDYANGAPGAWQPCRLGDFRGYDHNASQFVESPGSISFNPDRQEYMFLREKSPLPISGLKWTDMSAINGKYLCVAVFDKSDGNLVGYKTSDTTFGATEPDVTLKVNTDDADVTLQADKEYEYLLCVCNVKKTDFMAVVSGNPAFFPIPAEPDLTDMMKYSLTIDYLSFEGVGVVGNWVPESGIKYFNLPSRYSYVMVGQEPRYLGTGSSGRIAILLRVDNADSEAHSSSYIYAEASPTLVSTTPKRARPQIYSVESYDPESQVAQVGSNTNGTISVPAKSSRYFVLYLPDLLRTMDNGSLQGSVSASDEAFITFTIQWNGTTAGQAMMPGIYVNGSTSD